MNEPEDRDPTEDDGATLLAGASPLMMAREYWANARTIGDPGSPNMIEGAEQQRQNALMAATAAVVSIAESLHTVAQIGRADRRQTASAAKSLDTLAKEFTKVRYFLRKSA